MNQTELTKRQERAATEPLVIQEIAEGFRVYAAGEPRNRYVVSGPPDTPTCTCPDFQFHRSDPDWQCKHILAVLNAFSDLEVITQIGDAHATEEGQAIQEENRTTKPSASTGRGYQNGNGISQLLLKRSVSPDGRIDSLSVEISAPVDGLPAVDIHGHAERMLRLQSGIVAQFLNARGNGSGRPERHNGDPQEQPKERSSRTSNGRPATVQQVGSGMESPAIPAVLVDVAGMNGKWGRRLFINVQVDSRTLKLFGKPEELVQHIRAAGYLPPEPFGEGSVLDIPCAVTTKPSPDGRYTNVERVHPATQAPSRSQPVRRIGQ